MKISSIIIAKDEEANIGRCIDSLENCIDEIIVMIDNSTKDKTEQIVKNKNIYYELVEWKGYTETKRYAVTRTNNEWILWIDADEALTKELADELKEFKNKDPRFDAYSFPRKANFLGKWIKHSGWYPARVTRLFNKNTVRFSDNSVHENLVISGETGQLKSDLEHYTDPTIEHYFNKFNKYTTLAAKELADKNKTAKLSDILLRPVVIFFKMYVFRLGFLDGIHGLILAVFSSAYVFTKYCKLREIKKSD